VQALSIDHKWLKQHTRLGERSVLWLDSGRRADRLLRGNEIDEAFYWLSTTPNAAATVTDRHRDFILASKIAQDFEHRHRTTQQEEQAAVATLSWKIRSAIEGVAAVLFLAFVIYISHKYSLWEFSRTLLNPKASQAIWGGTLILYYLAWIVGGRTDAALQARIFRFAPDGGKFPRIAMGTLAGIAIAGAVLIAVDTFAQLIVALIFFWLVNVTAWWHFKRSVAGPIIIRSREVYERNLDFLGIEKLTVIGAYITGEWQVRRFAAGLLVWGMGLVMFAIKSTHPQQTILLREESDWTLMAFVFGSYVLVMELWILSERMRTHYSIRVLDALTKRYTLQHAS
jgi:hypothetical protein